MYIKKIAIQGELGSFHHAAAQSRFGTSASMVPCNTFKETFLALQSNKADAAVVAIENSLHGSINEVYDLLLNFKYPIVGEVVNRINQCLIGFSNTKLDDIRAVYSHPVALSQCRDFLDTFLPYAERHENYDTSASVAYIKKLRLPCNVAIASQLAADLHGLKVLKKNIQNYGANYTRFLIIEKNGQIPQNANKSSLVIETHHKPGALYDVLGILKLHDVNMSKLQSRPIQKKAWRYMFYIDIETDINTTQLIAKELIAMGCNTTVLGSYEKALDTVDI